MEEKKIIFCLLGKSASGKDTLINMITSSNANVSKLIPTTTRPKRKYEKTGWDYNFVSESNFMNRVENNKFMEHRKYDVITSMNNHGVWYYGTEWPKSKVSILTGPLEVYEKIKLAVLDSPDKSGEYDVIPIYIRVPEDERLYRMIRRECRNGKTHFRELARRYVQDNKDFNEDYMKSLGIDESNTFENIDKDVVVKQINDYINKYIEK